MTPAEFLPRVRGTRVLVVGDLMLDEFVWGTVTRISPEAPVPVVQVVDRTHEAGGAANTAANIAALGGVPVVAGVVGDDAGGDHVCRLLTARGADVRAVARDATRPTTTKTRVLAHSQQMLRVDHERTTDIAPDVEDRLLAGIDEQLGRVRGCVVSDYGKGVVSRRFVGELLRRCRDADVPVVVDPKGTDYLKYRGATLVKPNLLEAAQVLNRQLPDATAVAAAGRELVERLGTSILITQGAAGMSVFERGRPTVHIPAQAREVFDVTGAGDTVAGTLTLALAGGIGLEAACRLASAAAAVVVGKVGTATVTGDELTAAFGSPLRAAA